MVQASDRSITNTASFKLKAVQEYNVGKTPTQIFIENRFDLDVLGKDQPKRSLQRWRKTFKQFGEVGFQSERRGKASTGRPTTKNLSADLGRSKKREGIPNGICYL
ncbi:hypothetical protein ACFVAD_10805 [Sutcliffiella sp. NPDC057660]|uniref:hypothetical protein n=1 Tax=Sutcliffiella sp. NPDC057660 TaxID=3346199 RepID=UPI0036A41168